MKTVLSETSSVLTRLWTRYGSTETRPGIAGTKWSKIKWLDGSVSRECEIANWPRVSDFARGSSRSGKARLEK